MGLHTNKLIRKYFIRVAMSLFILFIANVDAICQYNKTNEEDSIFKKYTNAETVTKSNFYLVKNNPKFANCHFKIIRAITSAINIVEITDKNVFTQKNNCIEKIVGTNNVWKYTPNTGENLNTFIKKNTLQTFTIIVNDLNTFLNKWNKNEFAVIQNIANQNALVIKCNARFFANNIIPDNDVLYADVYIRPTTEIQLIGYNRSLNKINLANESIPNANGNGIIIGIKEKLMDVADIDLQKRVNASTIASTELDNHATVIATLAGGAGNSFYTGKGLAWKCRFYSSTYSNLFPDDANVLVQNNVTVQNHSYGTIIQNFYGAETVAYDAQTWQNKNIIHIFSSGNKGQEANTQGTYANISGFANLTGNFKMAKNIITVAATDTAGVIEPFSSAGPLYDGRIAPQIAALGPNGTSDAAALVSGATAIIQQVYRDSNSNIIPTAAAVKAILYNSADDIGIKGIDYKSGFGALNVFKAIKIIEERKYENNQLAHNENWVKNITVPTQAANLKITLCWTDTAALLQNNKALVNDLDIELTELATGNKYLPWVLSTFSNMDSLKLLPKRKRDSLNTAEQISIDFPTAGQYQIKIIGKQIQTASKQAFSIAYSWDTIYVFNFTNPINADDVDRNEDEKLSIKWNVALPDTNAVGNLAITYNNGVNWQPIASSIKLIKQQYKWTIPDTATKAKLKMDCAFGTFFSKDFIIAPVTKLNIAFFCKDSMQLSWNPHIYANSYTISTLLDSAYLKNIASTSDTSIVLQRNNNIGNIFTVKPLLSNGLWATKSAAVDVRSQAVNCYYKTLLADIDGNTINITLELSTTINIDSVQFEKLDELGKLIEKLEKQKVLANQIVYNTKDKNPTAGRNYYRAKIFLKSGSSFYSGIASVISNGNKFIFMYPNPTRYNQSLNYQVKEVIGAMNFVIYDMQGRLLRTQSIGTSGKIETKNLATGIFVFKIVNDNGTVLDTGKFIITN
jgi:Subtilase family/Secretion system C-terminal sorting domain